MNIQVLRPLVWLVAAIVICVAGLLWATDKAFLMLIGIVACLLSQRGGKEFRRYRFWKRFEECVNNDNGLDAWEAEGSDQGPTCSCDECGKKGECGKE
jgi:hypothetical protein